MGSRETTSFLTLTTRRNNQNNDLSEGFVGATRGGGVRGTGRGLSQAPVCGIGDLLSYSSTLDPALHGSAGFTPGSL